MGYTLLSQSGNSVDAADSWTFTGMDAGPARPGRLLVAALHVNYNPARTLLSATIGGIPATVVEHGDGLGFAYAVVPEGATVDVTATWTGTTTWSHYCALFEVHGTQSTHGDSGGAAGGGRGIALTSAAGGVVLGIAHLAAETASWGGFYLTRLTQGTDTASGQQFSLMGGYSPGYTYPVRVTNGIGTSTRGFNVIAFDPA